MTEKFLFCVDKPTFQSVPSQLEKHSMKKCTLLLAGLALLFTVALPLHAQDGCTNSPENPTAILAVVGSAGAFFASVRSRIKARRKSGK
jgi:XrtJ-associated TM-motif-TM protein